MLPSERHFHWINAHFVDRRKSRLRIQPFKKEEAGIAVDIDPRAAFGLVRRQQARHLLVDADARGFRQRGKMQPAVEPDSALHFFRATFLGDIERLEADDERGDQLTGFRRRDRQRDDLVDGLLGGAGAAEEVTDLRHLRQRLQSELRFFVRTERADLAWIRRRQNRAAVIEEPIEARMRNTRELVGLRTEFVLHDVAQLVLCARIKKIERVVFEGRVNARFRHERATALRQRGVTKFFDLVQGVEVRLEIAFQILLESAGRVALRKIKAGRGQPRHDEHHRDRKPRAKTCGGRFPFLAQSVTENRLEEWSRLGDRPDARASCGCRSRPSRCNARPANRST